MGNDNGRLEGDIIPPSVGTPRIDEEGDVIYVRQGDGCAEVVAAMDEGLFVQKIDLKALLALIETASRVALILSRDGEKK